MQDIWQKNKQKDRIPKYWKGLTREKESQNLRSR
jgi:hypothetical protein